MTPKQEAFVLAYLESGNASEAYRRAYSAENMKDSSVRVQAAKMLASPNIALRVEQIRKPAVDAAQMTLEQHLRDLQELRDKAKEEGKYSAAVTAEVARGKVAGFYVEKVEQVGPLVVNVVRLTDA
jgi:phage terminase small subunit